MTARNLSYTIASPTGRPDLGDAIRAAIRNNAHAFLNPPITNLGHIGKAAGQVARWLDRSTDPPGDASEILTELAARERHAMQTLAGIRTD